ncbi:MAG: tetratricopeptide repeat protein [Pseudomonadota bacterium]
MSSTDFRPWRAAWLLLAATLAACSSTPKPKPEVDNVNVVRSVRQQPTAPAVAASDSVHQTTVTASSQAQAAAQQAIGEYFAAVQAMKAGKLNDALVGFQAISAQHPVLSGPLVNQALIYIRQEKWEDALDSIDQTLKVNPKNPFAWNMRGIVLREQGKFKEARAAYEKALAIDGNYAKAHFNLGVLADLYLQDLNLALKHYERYQALQRKPDQAVGNWIGDLRNRLGIAAPAPATPPAAPAEQSAPAAAPAATPATGQSS